MKRALLITQDFPPRLGGVATYYSRICRQYPPGGIAVLAPVISDHDGPAPDYPLIRRRFFTTARWIWPRWLPLIWAIWREMRAQRPDVILVGQVLPIGTTVWLVTRLLRRPFIVFSHGLDIMLPQMGRRRSSMLRVLRSAAFIISNSEYTRRELIRLGLEADRVRVLTPGCDLSGQTASPDMVARLRRDLHLEGAAVLLTVARLEERKGHDTVLAALAEIGGAAANVKYLIVGEGTYRSRLESLVQSYGLSERVIFTGAVDGTILPAYYALADIFIMPSRQLSNRDVEGFGIAYLEAGAFGKPVIGGRSGGVGEAIVDGQTGLLVNPTDNRDVARALRLLLESPDLRHRLGENGRARVRRDFDWQQRTTQLTHWLENL